MDEVLEMMVAMKRRRVNEMYADTTTATAAAQAAAARMTHDRAEQQSSRAAQKVDSGLQNKKY